MSGHSFLPHLMSARPIVLDLGANRGNFRDGFLRRFAAARYVTVEANPKLAAELHADQRCEVLNCAIAESDGAVQFSIADNIEASCISKESDGGTIEVEGLTLGSLLRKVRLQKIDLVKVDIEGAELPMIMRSLDGDFDGIGQLTIEFHDFRSDAARDTPALSNYDVQEIVRRLESLGFVAIRFSRDNTNWCFVRKSLGRGLRVGIARHFTAPLRRLKHLVQSRL